VLYDACRGMEKLTVFFKILHSASVAATPQTPLTRMSSSRQEAPARKGMLATEGQ
jgi:hypothetical protein